MPTDAYHPIIMNLTEERKNFQSPGTVLSYLQNVSLSLPDKSLSEETARNLTEVKLGLRSPGRGGGRQSADDRRARLDLHRVFKKIRHFDIKVWVSGLSQAARCWGLSRRP